LHIANSIIRIVNVYPRFFLLGIPGTEIVTSNTYHKGIPCHILQTYLEQFIKQLQLEDQVFSLT